jgi:hypothetical protein
MTQERGSREEPPPGGTPPGGGAAPQQPLPKRRPGASPRSAPPPSPVAHPLPSSLPRPLTRPGDPPAPPGPPEAAPAPPQAPAEPRGNPGEAAGRPAPVPPAARAPLSDEPTAPIPAVPAAPVPAPAAGPESAGVPALAAPEASLAALPVRRRVAGRPAAPLRHVTVTRLSSLSRLPSAAGPAPAASPPAPARAPATPPSRSAPPGTPLGRSRAAAAAAAAAPAARRPASPSGAIPAPAPEPAAAPPPAPRHPAPSLPFRSARRPRRPAMLAGVAAALLACAVAAAVIVSRNAAPTAALAGGQAPALSAAAQARQGAAAWVASQVSGSSIVACDPEMCAALQARGVTAGDLLPLGPGTADPLGANVVVATAAVRNLFGARLSSVYAPAVLARFGSGPARIEVRIVAPDGAAAYQSALAADVQARRGVAAQLLANPRLLLSAQARSQLLAGQVDDRLLLTLPALAAVHPVQVLAFSGAGPGGDPDLPLSTAVLGVSPVPPGAGISAAAYTAWLLGYLNGQRPPFSAAAGATQLSGGGTVVTVQYSSPAPLGLLGN